MARSPLTYFDSESAAGDLLSPIWSVRLLPAVALVAILLGMSVWRTGNAHEMCLGFAVGQLVGAVICSFSIRGVVVKDTHRSDVQELGLNG